MNRLDKISYYLSYTDTIPILNVPSAIIHLICAIRDQALLPQVYPIPANESFRQLATRKLDDWSHLKKGLLAITVIGSAILFHNWAKRKWEVHQLCNYAKSGGKTGRFPILNDQDVFSAFLKERNAHKATRIPRQNIFYCSDTWSYAYDLNDLNKKDKNFIMRLINDKLINVDFLWLIDSSMRNDPEVVIALIKNNTDWNKLKDFYYNVLPDTLKIDKGVVSAINLRKKMLESTLFCS
jgi:hypothetical protein